MKKLILIIMFLLICSSLVLADIESPVTQGVTKEDFKVSHFIVGDMFLDGMWRDRCCANLRLGAFLAAAGYDDFSKDVINDAFDAYNDFNFVSTLFYKYNKKYKYSISDENMLFLTYHTLLSFMKAYVVATIDSLEKIFRDHKDIADYYKNNARKGYDDYLEIKKNANKNGYEASVIERENTELSLIKEGSIGFQYRGKIVNANKLMLQRKYDEARKLVDNVIIEFETEILKMDTSHFSFASKDEYREFIKTKGDVKVTWIDWSYSQAYFIKAFIAAELFEFEEALKLLDKVIELSPYDSQPHGEKGNILNMLQKPNEALLEYKAAFDLSERFSSQSSSKAIALRGMGYSYIELGELSKAKQMYEESLKIDAESDIAIQELENIKLLLKKPIKK